MTTNNFGPGTFETEQSGLPTTVAKGIPHYILIVDDDTFILEVAANTLTLAGYRCRTARSAHYALRELQNSNQIIDLMLADVMMPVMDGFDLVQHALELQPNLPVIMISSASELDTPVRALRAGSADYLVKPFNHQDLVKCVAGALTRRHLATQKTQAATWDIVARALTTSLDARDKETEGHAQRVAAYSTRLGQQLGLSHSQLDTLRLGALLHDIGKIGVPDSVLKKPAKLTDDEKAKMRPHPTIGRNMVLSVELPSDAAQIVGEHHEQWNGAGYPLGLKGEEICLGARIFAVADAFDAITSDRVYRLGRPYQVALDEILKFSGTQFDPQVVAAFVQVDPAEWDLIKSKFPSEAFTGQSRLAS